MPPESVFLTTMLYMSTATSPDGGLGNSYDLALSGLKGTGEGKAVAWEGVHTVPGTAQGLYKHLRNGSQRDNPPPLTLELVSLK